MYDILFMSQSHFNNTQIFKHSNAFGIRACLTKPKIRVSHEAEQYRVIDHTIDDSEVKRMAITQTSVDPDSQANIDWRKKNIRRWKSQSSGYSFIFCLTFSERMYRKYITSSLAYNVKTHEREKDEWHSTINARQNGKGEKRWSWTYLCGERKK